MSGRVVERGGLLPIRDVPAGTTFHHDLHDEERVTMYSSKRSVLIAVLFGSLLMNVGPADAADIAWITEPRGPTVDFDLGWTDVLTAAGHNVTRMNDMAELDQGKIDAMNAADLVIISRSANSGNYDDGDEPQQWNAITSPMINLAAHTVRSNRWKWFDSTSITTGHASITAVDASHPILGGIAAADIAELVAAPNDELISAVATSDGGNGTVLANFASGDVAAVLWEPGTEYYAGSGEVAGDYRLFLPMGQSNISGEDEWGGYNLTAQGEQIFMNAVDHMMAIPEPATVTLIVIGLLGTLGIRRHRHS